MKVVMTSLVFILMASLSYSQDSSSLEPIIINNTINLASNASSITSGTPAQQITKQPEKVQQVQTSNKNDQSASSQNVQVNSTQDQKTEQQVHSLPPQQYHSPSENIAGSDEQQGIQQHDSHQSHQAFHQTPPGLNLIGLTVEEQQKLLSQQKLLQEYANRDLLDQFSKYENYTHEQLLQLQQRWGREAKIAHQNAMKQLQQREKAQREQLKKMIAQQHLTKTQQITHKQNLQFRQRSTHFNPNIHLQGHTRQYKHHFNEYMFELESGEFQDFEINLAVAQTIAIHSATYTKNQGVYSRATEVDSVPPQLQVYENGRFAIVNQEFHFKKFVFFEGKANTNYLIRIISPGNSRLFSLSVVHVIDKSQVGHALTADDFLHYGPRAAKIYDQIKQEMEHSKGLSTMQISNQNTLNSGINHYFRYSLLELGLVIGACVIQVKLIEKLLSTSSIV